MKTVEKYNRKYSYFYEKIAEGILVIKSVAYPYLLLKVQ